MNQSIKGEAKIAIGISSITSVVQLKTKISFEMFKLVSEKVLKI